MPQPHFTLTITAGAVAWYAAIVSTMSSTIQFANYLRDRVHIKIKVQRNMETVNDPCVSPKSRPRRKCCDSSCASD